MRRDLIETPSMFPEILRLVANRPSQRHLRKSMGFYAKYVLPRLIDLAMRNKETARVRAECIPQARGDVLEIGIGSGLNLPFYSSQVRRVYGLEPSFELQRMARALDAPVVVEFLSQSAEDPVPLANSSVD